MRLILWPAVVTLVITLLRLMGELQGWSRALFNPEAGGGGAVVGISWLPFIFGPYFAWKLAKQGRGAASPWKVAGLALLAVVLIVGAFAATSALGSMGFVVGALVALGLAFLPWKAWPELTKVLFFYALAARVPVMLVMLVAIYGDWGTHYDVLPPDPPPELVAAGPLARWFYIGLIPQATFWVAQTMLVGALVGAIVVAVAKPRAEAPAA